MNRKWMRPILSAAVAVLMLVSPAWAQTLVPGGQSIGVAIKTEGVVVIGASDVGSTPSPARLAGLRGGDIIKAIDGNPVSGAADIGGMLTQNKCRVTYDRRGETRDALLTPVFDREANIYRLGVWVRDSAAGIGTLTYYDPETGRYGALGHPVTDADAEIVLPLAGGSIYENSIIGVEKGRSGEPGEILGQFYEGMHLGNVDVNSEYGIFGNVMSEKLEKAYADTLETAPRESVKPGPATIRTTVDGSGLQEYRCEILSIEDASPDSTRSFLLSISDPRLIETTGGIVQGMSGSPIIQGGKLVGAVTHVLINDPTKGYGIFIENMLEAAENGVN